MLEAKVLGRNARHVYGNTLSQAFYGDFLLLLTLDLQDNVPDDVWNLHDEAEGANINREAF